MSDDETPARLRWFVQVQYKDGFNRSTHLEELEELHDFVEDGEDFYTIDKIIVKPNFEYDNGDPETGKLVDRLHGEPRETQPAAAQTLH